VTGFRQGLFFPPFDALADPELVARVAAAAETAGWDGVFLWDHLLYAEPVREILDPWICLAAIAMATTTITIGPMVTPLPRRRPAVVARQAMTLDRLSHGRLVLGLGLGDDGGVGELSRFGEELDATVRGRSLTEGLDVLTGLLAGEPVHHRGPQYTADGVTFLPRPWRPEGIPIWLAARWPNQPPLRRAAGHGGVVMIQLTDPAQLVDLRERLVNAGADLDRFDIVIVGKPGDDPGPWAEAGATWLLTQLGPYHLDLDEVLAVATAGPLPAGVSPSS
jgi:alkanesulfonate monooxygenase SsuD/methylene tetrahydromethanopterin reductase-like flavin-dependent oxidoreductase (luciferase family)